MRNISKINVPMIRTKVKIYLPLWKSKSSSTISLSLSILSLSRSWAIFKKWTVFIICFISSFSFFSPLFFLSTLKLSKYIGISLQGRGIKTGISFDTSIAKNALWLLTLCKDYLVCFSNLSLPSHFQNQQKHVWTLLGFCYGLNLGFCALALNPHQNKQKSRI